MPVVPVVVCTRSAAVVDAVAGDADVVGGGRPGEGDAGGGACGGGDVARRGGRLAVGARGRGGRHRRLRGGVAGLVERSDPDRVCGSAGEPVDRVAGRGARADLGGGAVDVVAGDADVVGRCVPGDRDARCGGRGDAQVAGRRRSSGVRRRRWWWVVLAADGGGDGVGGEQGAAVVSARTWKVCWPLLVVIDPSAKLSPNGASCSLSTSLPSIEELHLAGVVLDVVAVTVVDATPVDDPRDGRAVGDRLGDRSPSNWAAAAVVGVWLPMVAVTVLVASRVPLSVSARTWKVCWPLLVVIDPSAKLSPNGISCSLSTSLPSTRNSILPGSSSLPSPLPS